jgi:hypothetical protein
LIDGRISQLALFDFVAEVLNESNMDGDPGYPYNMLGFSSNRAVFESNFQEVVELVFAQFLLLFFMDDQCRAFWHATGDSSVWKPNSVFVKDQVDTEKKRGIPRTIHNVGLLNGGVERVMFAHWLRSFKSDDMCFDTKVGMGFSQEKVFQLRADVREGCQRFPAHRLVTSDVASWDASVPLWLIMATLSFFTRGCHPAYRRAVHNYAIVLASSWLISPDGNVFRKTIQGLMPSGSNLTTVLNSCCRTVLSLFCGSKAILNLGDDALEWTLLSDAEMQQSYLELGFTLREVNSHTSESFIFCSHLFQDGVARLIDHTKIFAGFCFLKRPDVDHVTGLSDCMRNKSIPVKNQALRLGMIKVGGRSPIFSFHGKFDFLLMTKTKNVKLRTITAKSKRVSVDSKQDRAIRQLQKQILDLKNGKAKNRAEYTPRDKPLPAPRIPKELTMRGESDRCVRDFMKVLTDPFMAAPPCVPHSPYFDSMPYKTFVRGTATVGTGGVGGVIVRTTAANDQSHVTQTNVNYAGTVLPTSGDVGTTNIMNNSMFPLASFGGTDGKISVRHGMTVMRFRYSGTTFDEGGTNIFYASPIGAGVAGSTRAQLLGHPEAQVMAPNRDWMTFLFVPDVARMNNTSSTYQPWAYNTDPSFYGGASHIGFMFNGTPSAADFTYEYEIVQFFEAYGTPVATMSSPSYGDDDKFTNILSWLNRVGNQLQDQWFGLSPSAQDKVINALMRGVIVGRDYITSRLRR